MAKRKPADPRTVHGRLRIAIQEAGGLGAVAKRMKVSVPSILSNLRGKNIFFARAAAIANATGVSLDWIATGDGVAPGEEPEAAEALAYPDDAELFDGLMQIAAAGFPDGAEAPIEQVQARAARMLLASLGEPTA